VDGGFWVLVMLNGDPDDALRALSVAG